eukprot:gnl/TRDRNA2_/TRDRNA2_208274_c0_seq1.p1 gnl/TRDRNA2_/TRDRNA2_208274_c0~~gnl/TRDRNA2_/TRDRNA2_208274_c0_seq1.p1  ORF type:complete len:359 (+),score=59.60 gnl/TRDRNA2_/TRDRNA2_208274_c0_seq1:109-1077(+)
MARLLQLQADPNNFVRHGNTAILAVIGADATAMQPAAMTVVDDQQTEMLRLLLEARADPNHVNSSMMTALDYASKLSAGSRNTVSKLLEDHGALSFREVGPVLESKVNAQLATFVNTAFESHASAFGAAGGGGTGAKLLGSAAHCLQMVAAILKLYPCAPSLVEVQVAQARSGKELAEKQAEARAQAIVSVLQDAGASNIFKTRTAARGIGVVRITMSFKAACRKDQHADCASKRQVEVQGAAAIDANQVRDQAQRKKKISELFQKLDRDGNGSLSLAEFQLFWQSLNADISPEEVTTMFTVIDRDKNGSISCTEFLDWTFS